MAVVVLSCDHLVRVYDTPTGRIQAVRGVDLSISAGRLVAIVGPSGCGKSSLLRLLSGIDRPTAGSVWVRGEDITRLGDRARARVRGSAITHVYQRPRDNLFGHLTAFQQLERMVPRQARQHTSVAEILEALALGDHSGSTPDRMSGGERQRLAFARGIAAGHQIVIADEPTAHLDADNVTLLLDAMDQLANNGSTVIVATHDRRVLERMHEVVALRDGAVATITEAGSEVSVIDRSGRIQLPPEAQRLFGGRRARLTLDSDAGRIVLEQP